MTIFYEPSVIAKKLASKAKLKKLVRKNLTLNQAVLRSLANSSDMSKKSLEQISLKVLKTYKKNYKEELKAGLSKAKALDEALNDAKLMVQRVQNAIIEETTDMVKEQYWGERYRWLPSDAEEPRPEHQLKYGKIYTIGKGEAPGDLPGCRCGMEILVDGDELEL